MAIDVTPIQCLADEITQLVIKKLTPCETYECTFSTIDKHGERWSSSYAFPSNPHGEIHIWKLLDHPLAYIRDMRCGKDQKFHNNESQPFSITLTVYKEGEAVGQKTLVRHFAKNIQKVSSIEKGLYAYGYLPHTQTVDAAVVLFSGSGGGLGEARASLYASRGISTFSLPYFLHEGLPKSIENIDLDSIKKAVLHIKKRFHLKKLVALGNSRGGELVLVLASLFPELFDGVIAVVPSAVTYGGMPDMTKPAWLHNGKNLPMAPFPTVEEILQLVDPKKPIAMAPFFLQGMHQHPRRYEQAKIRVENIRCPLQLISAENDAMWPSTTYCEQIEERRIQHGIQSGIEHIRCKGAGHIFHHPYVPTTCQNAHHPLQGVTFDNGGETKAQFEALEKAWNAHLGFIFSL